MSNCLKKVIHIVCDTKEAMVSTRDKIHDQLTGNSDYINNRIILNDSDDRSDRTINEVRVYIFTNSLTVPDIIV